METIIGLVALVIIIGTILYSCVRAGDDRYTPKKDGNNEEMFVGSYVDAASGRDNLSDCISSGKSLHENQRVVSKLSVKIVSGEAPEDTEIISGGLPFNPTWDEYLEIYLKAFHERLKLIKECIISNNLVGVKADAFCNDNYFEFSDGRKIAFTWRAWGDLMQAIVNKREGYMKYYM